MARTVALLSEVLRPCTTRGPVLKLSPSTAQFMPRNWLVAAMAGDEMTMPPAIAVVAATSTISSRRNDRVLRGGPAVWPRDDVVRVRKW